MIEPFKPYSILEEACRSMLATRGLTLQLIDGPDPASHEVSYGASSVAGISLYYVVLGLAGDRVKGSLVLEAPKALLEETHPAIPAATSSEGLLDWAGELTNQVLGRVKNRCAGLGVNFSLGIPTVVTGEEISLYSPHGENRTVLWFQSGPHRVGVSLEIQLDPALLTEAAAPVEVLAEGEMVML